MKKISVVVLSLLVSLLLAACTDPAAAPTTAPTEGNNEERCVFVCVGDSITYGAGVSHREENSYPAILLGLLGDGFKVENYSFIGATASDNGDITFSTKPQYNDALKSGGDVFIIMFGTNDSKAYNWDPDAYKKGMERYIDIYREINADAYIYLMTPPCAFEYTGEDERWQGQVGYDIDADVIENEICPMVTSIAEDKNVGLIDLHTFTQGHPEWFGDGIHPNLDGNRALAEYIYEQLSETCPAVKN